MPRDHKHADQANDEDDGFFDTSPEAMNSAAQNRLKSFVDRLERLQEDRAAVNADMKEVFGEAKGEGFDTKILRKVLKLRGMDKAKRQEEEALIDLYLSAIGGL